MKELFKELSRASGAGGDEGDVRRIVRRELEGVVDQMRVDRMGSLFASFDAAAPDAPVLMFTAHLDEIGLMVSRVEDFGGVRFEKLGWVDDRMLISRLVVINTRRGKVNGLIGVPAASRIPKDEKSGPTPYKRLYIDVGSASREETESLGVQVGDRITFRGDFAELENGFWVAKSVDDRAGVCMLIEVMKLLKDHRREAKIVAAFLAQHEIGLRGAIPAAYSVDPDISVHLDVTGNFADDPAAGARLEEGPVLRLMEDYGTHIGFGAQKGVLVHRHVVDRLVECAQDLGIPYQLQIKPGVIGDEVAIHTSRAGVLAGYILTPARYIHSQYECVRQENMEQSITLAVQFGASINREFVEGAVDLDRLA
jgi:putative aminopeptidase FrvX